LFSTKTKGIGLGLTVSKMLTEINNGRVEVKSALGKGSIFTLYLPLRKSGKEKAKSQRNKNRKGNNECTGNQF